MYSLSPTVVPDSRKRDETSAWMRLLTPAPQVCLAGPLDNGRHHVESYVAQRYQISFGARVDHCMPWLLSLECLGDLSGVAGMQIADENPLFLEQYLDVPVEQLMNQVPGKSVARNSIVEIGNLVAEKRGVSHLLFLLFTSVLLRAGYEHIVFTATRALRNNLTNVGFALEQLQKVDTTTLDPATIRQWGNYYRTDPMVVTGSLAAAGDIIQSRPLLRRVLRLYRPRIDELAAQLQRV